MPVPSHIPKTVTELDLMKPPCLNFKERIQQFLEREQLDARENDPEESGKITPRIDVRSRLNITREVM
jgi:hypothetical protein